MTATDNLTKKFDEHTVVDRLLLNIDQGEILRFLRPNGAGKTATVRMPTTLIRPTSGSAQVLGLSVGTNDQAIRKQVGIQTETPGLYARLSAARNPTI